MWNYLNDEIKYTFLDVSDELLKDLESDIRKRGDEVYRTSNVKADMTNWSIDVESFKMLESIISKKMNREISYQNHWGIIYRDGDHAIPHSHDGGEVNPDMSFVFYVNTPEGSGILHFCDYDIFLPPEKNMLVTFNSTVKHEVFPNTVSGIERVATAGNVFFSVDNVQELR